jgi:hypothetical protein
MMTPTDPWDGELERLIIFPLLPEDRAAFLEAVTRPLIDPPFNPLARHLWPVKYQEEQ